MVKNPQLAERLLGLGVRGLRFAAIILNIQAAKEYLVQHQMHDGCSYEEAMEHIEQEAKSKTKMVMTVAACMMIFGGLARYLFADGVFGLIAAIVSYSGLLLLSMHMFRSGARANMPSIGDMFKRRR